MLLASTSEVSQIFLEDGMGEWFDNYCQVLEVGHPVGVSFHSDQVKDDCLTVI